MHTTRCTCVLCWVLVVQKVESIFEMENTHIYMSDVVNLLLDADLFLIPVLLCNQWIYWILFAFVVDFRFLCQNSTTNRTGERQYSLLIVSLWNHNTRNGFCQKIEIQFQGNRTGHVYQTKKNKIFVVQIQSHYCSIDHDNIFPLWNKI